MQKVATTILLCLMAVVAHAQTNCPEPILREAKMHARKNDVLKSIAMLEISQNKYPLCFETYQLLAELYAKIGQNDKCVSTVVQSTYLNETSGVALAFQMQKILQAYKEDTVAVRLMQEMDKLSLTAKNKSAITYVNKVHNESVVMQQKAIVHEPKNVNWPINTDLNQSFPSLSIDGMQMVYISAVNPLNEDFLIATRDTCTTWSRVDNLGYPPNTGDPERSVQLTADGKYLFFTRCNSRSENGWDGGGCDISFCYREEDTFWSSPQKFGATINSPDYEGDAHLSADNSVLYFVSDRAGGYGGKDIWMSKLVNGYWQKPLNCGSNVNTSGNETAPFLHADMESLYFASDGRGGVGGADFFYCKKREDTIYTAAKNLGFPINTRYNENSICIAADGKHGYISTVNSFTKYDYDIYKIEVHNSFAPTPSKLVTGFVYDKQTKEKLKRYRVHVYDMKGNEVHNLQSNEGDGSFSFVSKSNMKYYYTSMESEAYQPFVDTIDLVSNAAQLVQAPAPLKPLEGIDTLFAYAAPIDVFMDTNLCYIKNKFAQWKHFASDSVVAHVQFTQNNFVDTTFIEQVCFSDEGLYNYRKWLHNKQQEKIFRMRAYAKWYEEYLIYAGFRKENIISTTQETIDTDDRLMRIETSIIEIY